MAHITEFTVEGLAGRTEAYSQRLDRHVNVFFGLNGSGKTSLLKILNGAMSIEADSLQSVPFKRAEVKIYSIDRDKIYTYTYEKPPERETVEGDVTHAPIVAVSRTTYGTRIRRKKPSWKVDAEEDDQKAVERWAHSYLPIARLYAFSDRLTRVHWQAEHPVGEITSEEELEESFKFLVNRLWSAYSADVLGTVQRAQAKGLADILKRILTGIPASDREMEVLNSPAVYDRVSRFMERQGSRGVLGDSEAFERNYQSNPQLRNAVSDINSVELQIETAMAPREKLQSLVEAMFTGNKGVTFTDSTIEITGKNAEKIGLDRLSSGEKQLIRILVEALRTGPHSLILDEPEISMHVDWQRQLIPTMRQLNPNAQIIAATHSPEIMGEIADSNIFRL